MEARKDWSLKVESLNPLSVDEATWDFTSALETEDEEEEEYKRRVRSSAGSAEPGTEEYCRRVFAALVTKDHASGRGSRLCSGRRHVPS